MEMEMNFTVDFELSITADNPEQAVRFALDDLRDLNLCQWTAKVKSESETVDVTIDTSKLHNQAVVPAIELVAARRQISELQRLLGKTTMEHETLKEAVACSGRSRPS